MAKKKTTTRKKTSASANRKKTSSARSKTSKKKTSSTAKKTTKKSVSRSKKKSSGKKTSKKTTKKSPARSAAKKSTTKKKTTKKAPSKKVTSKKKVSKKSPTKKSVSKKTGSKKKTTTKKSTAKKSSSKKTPTKKTPTKKTTKKTAAGAAAATTSKTTKTKKKKKKKTGRRTGRSVAEVASSSERDSDGYVFINGRRVRMISVNTEKMAKRTKTRSSSKAANSGLAIPATKKKIKKRFDRKQLKYYEKLLLEKRNELLGDLGGMEAQALRSDSGENSHMPTHMADAGSDAYEQDFMLSLAENERTRLVKIDAALNRIKDGSYGTCEMTGRAIPKARLEAKPWAKYTVEAAREVERRG